MILADARCLPFPSRTFDLVFTSPPWDEPGVLVEALPEMRRVLRTNGRMVLVLPHLDDASLASLVFTNRDGTERQSFAIPKPNRKVGPRYYSMDPAVVGSVLRKHKGRRLLDPFCGVGTIPSVARKLGWRATGVDVDRTALESS